jgi:hypothetical protein
MVPKKGKPSAVGSYILMKIKHIELQQANTCGLVSAEPPPFSSCYIMTTARDFEEEETKSSDEGKKAGSSKKEEPVVIPDSSLEPEVQVSTLCIILQLF